MTRNSEGLTILAGSGLAGLGVALVNLARDEGLDVQWAITLVVFVLAFGGLNLAVRTWAPKATPLLVPPVVALTAIGLVEVFRIDPDRGGLQRWWLLTAAAVAAAGLALLASSGTQILRRYRNVTLLASIGLLLLPNLPRDWPVPLRGLELNGSRLWVLADAGFAEMRFQPAELAKLGLVVFVAGYLADHQRALREAGRQLGPVRLPEPRQLIPLLITWAASILILVWQRDLGASILLFAGFTLLLYAATAAPGYLVAGGLLSAAGAVAAYTMFGHVRTRVTAWLAPFENYELEGYQIAQGLFALGSGSLSGSGPGLGQPGLIPNAATDFLFAAVGEELGFAGSVAVISLYALVIAVGFGIAFRSRDTFRKLLAAGLTLVFTVQVFLIVGGILRLVPLTGITLPFMSYGGSALVGNMLLVALLLRVSHEESA